MPKMRHPQSSKTIDVAPAQVAMYESQGWELQSAKKSAQTATNPKAPAASNKE